MDRRNASPSCILNPANRPQLLSDPDPFPSYGHSYQPSSNGHAYNPQAPPYQGHRQTETNRETNRERLHPDTDPFPVSQSSSVESPTESWGQEPKSPQDDNRYDPNRRVERNAQRSVRLFNLPPGVRRGDITAVIRGGPLLEVYLRPKEHTANVSFVYEDDATAFLKRAREHGLRVCGVSVSDSPFF